MSALLALWLLAAQPISAECYFVRWWSERIAHFADAEGLPENRYHIVPEGFPPEIYSQIETIKREVYHDRRALAKRIESACALKSPT